MHKKLIKDQIKACRECWGLFGYEPKPVYWGNLTAKIVHISQAPSLSVHQSQKPFNDQSGKRLRSWYQITDEVFYNPDNFYITSAAHCYPGRNPKGGDNQPPQICAEKWLKQEIAMVKPKLFLIVGGYAANVFFPGDKIAKLVFEDKFINNIPCFILPHPSPLNARWLKDHPEFINQRLTTIREAIRTCLG